MYENLRELNRILPEMQTETLRVLAMVCALWAIATIVTSISGLIWFLVSETAKTRWTETTEAPSLAALRLDQPRL